MPFTGVLAQLHPEETLNAALHLLPSTKHVVVVGGVGKFDEGFEAIAKHRRAGFLSIGGFTVLRESGTSHTAKAVRRGGGVESDCRGTGCQADEGSGS
jgi:hypothetical protein